MSWKLALPQYPEAQIIATVVEFLVLTHNLILLLLHVYSSSIAKRKSGKKHFEKLQILSFVVVIFSLIWSLANIAISFGLKPSFLNCQQFINILATSYTLTKISVYGFFLQRLYSVFTVHKYRFSSRFKHYCRLWLLIYLISTNAIGLSGSKHYHIIENNRIICVGNYPLYVLAIVAFFDFGTIAVLSILFTRRLMLLVISNYSYSVSQTLNANKVIQSDDKVVMIALNKDEEIMAMMKRITLLTVISLVTTFVSLILTAVFQLNSLWVGIDFCINNFCIVLMFKYNNKMYQILCRKCVNINISDNCLSCYSLNLCFPIELQSTTTKELNKTISTPQNISQIDDTKSTETSNVNSYEIIHRTEEEEETSESGSLVVLTK